MMPLHSQTGTPSGLEALAHLRVSVISGSADRITSRTRSRVSVRQSIELFSVCVMGPILPGRIAYVAARGRVARGASFAGRSNASPRESSMLKVLAGSGTALAVLALTLPAAAGADPGKRQNAEVCPDRQPDAAH